MARKRSSFPGIAYVGEISPPAERALKKQSRWSGEDWKPGEVPRTSFLPVHSGPAGKEPYGEYLGVRPPFPRGKGPGRGTGGTKPPDSGEVES